MSDKKEEKEKITNLPKVDIEKTEIYYKPSNDESREVI